MNCADRRAEALFESRRQAAAERAAAQRSEPEADGWEPPTVAELLYLLDWVYRTMSGSDLFPWPKPVDEPGYLAELGPPRRPHPFDQVLDAAEPDPSWSRMQHRVFESLQAARARKRRPQPGGES